MTFLVSASAAVGRLVLPGLWRRWYDMPPTPASWLRTRLGTPTVEDTALLMARLCMDACYTGSSEHTVRSYLRVRMDGVWMAAKFEVQLAGGEGFEVPVIHGWLTRHGVESFFRCWRAGYTGDELASHLRAGTIPDPETTAFMVALRPAPDDPPVKGEPRRAVPSRGQFARPKELAQVRVVAGWPPPPAATPRR